MDQRVLDDLALGGAASAFGQAGHDGEVKLVGGRAIQSRGTDSRTGPMAPGSTDALADRYRNDPRP